MRLAIPYRKDAGPGGTFTIIGFVTPVDERHCRVFFWRCRKVQDWQRDAWRFLYRNRLEALHWEVLEQDRSCSRRWRTMPATMNPLSARHRPVAASAPVAPARRGAIGGSQQRGGAVISLAGKRILVTGAARGLGQAFAQAAADAGAVVMLADLLAERGRATADAVGHGAGFVAIDLADPASIAGAVEEAASRLGGLDGLVNNAAIATGIGGKMFDEIDIRHLGPG